ncbi:Homeodomain-only protein [Orchesella cincta]|uniref:Homeodomain-only protein n=1 Tax=Orchesella cincta TaxID=48709 RepID=A0A1D2N5L9_ORCCI|nr:Homeodomain-only protein [Orchesella cincta]
MATSTVRYTAGQQKDQQQGEFANVELRLTEEQQEYLEKQFQKTKNPHPSELMLTAAETGLLEEEVQAWFKHRMALWRRDQGLNPVGSRIC